MVVASQHTSKFTKQALKLLKLKNTINLITGEYIYVLTNVNRKIRFLMIAMITGLVIYPNLQTIIVTVIQNSRLQCFFVSHSSCAKSPIVLQMLSSLDRSEQERERIIDRDRDRENKRNL